MKKIIAMSIILTALLAGVRLAPAADLVWDHDSYHERTAGFVVYTFALQRYNASGPSARSNTVEYGLEVYAPPTDHTPEPVSSAPPAAGDLRLE